MTHPIDYSHARFLQSAPDLARCPPDDGVEVAFAGRSNAGKSSALNALTRQNKLARISKTPGRTQLINFFDLGDQRRLVDLPGYGYAKVPATVKRDWDQNLAEYLQRRRSLRGLVLLMDIRHPLREYDWQMIHWTLEADLALHLLLTKADKLKYGPGKSTLLKVQQTLEAEGLGGFSVQTFSAVGKTGGDTLESFLDRCLTAE